MTGTRRWRLLQRLLRAALMLTAMVCLATGVWGGLLRLSWDLPLPTEHANWISFHGPLMIGGFLGTVIGVERATALGSPWPYAAPLLTAAGGIAVASGTLGPVPRLLFCLGSLALALLLLGVFWRHRAAETAILALGAAAWCTGNVLWWLDWPLPQLAVWWILFPVLTIAAERLELNRLRPPRPRSRRIFFALAFASLAAALASFVAAAFALRVTGLGLLGLSIWLLRFDLARHAVRLGGLPRFTATCLLSGYPWLAIGGVVLAVHAPTDSGVHYDAALHAILVGFVFSMIFGHAPIIFPAVTGVPIPFRRRFYVHLIVLHAATATRVTGDLLVWPTTRSWGALLGAVAIGVFLLNTASAAVGGAIRHRRSARAAEAARRA